MRTGEAVRYQKRRTLCITCIKRVAYSVLFLLTGVLFPVLIWVGLLVVIRGPVLQVVRRIAYAALFILVAILMPVLILVSYAIAIRWLLLRWREERSPSTTALGEVISKIKVLIVDDHAIVREGIRAVLDLQRDMQVIGEALDGREALEMSLDLHPDVVLMDIRMPEMNGFVATKEICRKCPEIKVLMLSQYDDEEYILASRQAGALGFIPKRAASPLLVSSIRSASQGKQFVIHGVN